MRYFPTIEVNRDVARAVWQHRAASMFQGSGWKVECKMVDIDRLRGIRTEDDARRFYAADAARLNAEYGKGATLYRAGSVAE